MLPLLALFDILARPLARSVLTSLRADSGLYFSYVFVQIEPCRAPCFTVVASHLEPTLPHFGETLKSRRLCLVCRSPLRPALLRGNFRFVFARFASRLRALHMCVLDLSHLPVVRACRLREVLSILPIAICDCSTLSQSVRVDCRMALLIRQS